MHVIWFELAPKAKAKAKAKRAPKPQPEHNAEKPPKLQSIPTPSRKRSSAEVTSSEDTTPNPEERPKAKADKVQVLFTTRMKAFSRGVRNVLKKSLHQLPWMKLATKQSW